MFIGELSIVVCALIHVHHFMAVATIDNGTAPTTTIAVECTWQVIEREVATALLQQVQP